MKVIISALLVMSSFAALAQDNKTEGTFPELKKAEYWEDQKIHAGMNLGVNSPEGSYDNTAALGVDIGFQPFIPFGMGAELFTTKVDSENNRDSQRTALLGKASYNFGGEIPVIRHSYVGLGFGPVLTRNTFELGYAPLLGFDIPLQVDDKKPISLGLNVKYLFTSTDSPDALMTNFALKFWL